MREYRKTPEVKEINRMYRSGWRENEENRERERVRDKEYRSSWREDEENRDRESAKQ